MLETLDYTIRIGSTPNFLYFDLYLYSAYAAHYVSFYISICISTLPTQHTTFITLSKTLFYNSLCQMVTRNLRSFLSQLQSKQALFQVETILSAPEIVLNPSAGEIFKITLQTVRDSVEG